MVFVHFLILPSNRPTGLLKLLIIIQLRKFTKRKMVLEDVQHVQQTAFFPFFVGYRMLDG